MSLHQFQFQILPLEQIQEDPHQPRRDFGSGADEERMLLSLEELGIQQPIVVHKINKNLYQIMDGHRRYSCAKKLKWADIPCRIHENLGKGIYELCCFEMQNNRKEWKPLERSNALSRIRDAKEFTSSQQLADYVRLSRSVVAASLQLREESLSHLSLMEKHEFSETYHIEIIRLRPKLRKIRELEIREVLEIILGKVEHAVIRNAKGLRKLGRIFLRASSNEERLYRFLTDPDMTIDELLEDGTTPSPAVRISKY